MSVETPSKVAAAALSAIELNTPKKASAPADTTLLAKLKAAAAAEQATMKPLSVASVVVDAPTPETAEVEIDSRKRFVGDVNCEEKDEPLLQESTSRFVLFPIKYREVSTVSNRLARAAHTT